MGEKSDVRPVSPVSSETQTLAAAQTGRTLRFTVPRLDLYGLAVIE